MVAWHLLHARLTFCARDKETSIDFGLQRAPAEDGFAPTTTYELVFEERGYPPKAILGMADEFATGRRLASGDFEGGKSGAVKGSRTASWDDLLRRSDDPAE